MLTDIPPTENVCGCLGNDRMFPNGGTTPLLNISRNDSIASTPASLLAMFHGFVTDDRRSLSMARSKTPSSKPAAHDAAIAVSEAV